MVWRAGCQPVAYTITALRNFALVVSVFLSGLASLRLWGASPLPSPAGYEQQQQTIGLTPVSNLHVRDTLVRRIARWQPLFQTAYQRCALYAVPGLAEAVGWAQTRLVVRTPIEGGTGGLPPAVTIFGIYRDTTGFFLSLLDSLAQFSGYSVHQLIDSPLLAMEAYICYAGSVFDRMLQRGKRKPYTGEDSARALLATLTFLSQIPGGTSGLRLAQYLFAQEVLVYLTDTQWRRLWGYGAPPRWMYRISFPEPYDSLLQQDFLQVQVSCNPPEYPQAQWVPAHSSNYVSPRTSPVSAIAIHTTQGTYSGTIAWFQNPNANVSAHYVIRARDGQVTQMVCEGDRAWHIGIHNDYTIGIEHEGWVQDPTWYTNALYASSASVVRDIATRHSALNLLRTVWWDWARTADYDQNGLPKLCVQIKGHQHFSAQSHTDPDLYWNWQYYYNLVNGLPSTDTIWLSGMSADTVLTNPGTPLISYPDDYRQGWYFPGTPDTPVVLILDTYSLETNMDYLLVYEGKWNGYLLRAVSGSGSGDTIVSSTGLYLEFRTDCSQGNGGWRVRVFRRPAPCPAPEWIILVDSSFMHGTVRWRSVPQAALYQVMWWQAVTGPKFNAWTTDTQIVLTGLAGNHLYHVVVRAWCSPGIHSVWRHLLLRTAEPTGTQYTTTLCRGYFRDSGGVPGDYRNQENYTLTISGNQPLSLAFLDFATEANFDYLYVQQAGGVLATLTGQPFNGPREQVYSMPPSISLSFQSDGYTTASGWTIRWDQCQKTFPVDVPIPDWIGMNPPLLQVIPHAEEGYRTFGYLFHQGNARTAVAQGFWLDSIRADAWTNHWSVYTGSWQLVPCGGDTCLRQTDESLSNTNASVFVRQDPNVAGGYLYVVRARIGGSGTNRRAGFHFHADTPSLPNRGNSYFVYFRVDHDRVQLYKVTNDSWTLVANVPYPIDSMRWYEWRVLWFPQTGEVTVYVDDVPVLQWQDPVPPTYVGRWFSLRSGNALYEVDEVVVFRVPGDVSLMPPAWVVPDSVVCPGSGGCTLAVTALAHTEIWSDVQHFGLAIDRERPHAPLSVWDGDQPGVDVDTFFSTTELWAHWRRGTDARSGVAYYEVAVVEDVADSVVTTWRSTVDTFIQWLDTFTPGVLYYVLVRTVDSAGNRSWIRWSDGQRCVRGSGLLTVVGGDTVACWGDTVCLRYSVAGLVDSVGWVGVPVWVWWSDTGTVCWVATSDTVWLEATLYRQGGIADTVVIRWLTTIYPVPAPPVIAGSNMGIQGWDSLVFWAYSLDTAGIEWQVNGQYAGEGYWLQVWADTPGTYEICARARFRVSAQKACRSAWQCHAVEVVPDVPLDPAVVVAYDRGGASGVWQLDFFSLEPRQFTVYLVGIDGRLVHRWLVNVEGWRRVRWRGVVSPGLYTVVWLTADGYGGVSPPIVVEAPTPR